MKLAKADLQWLKAALSRNKQGIQQSQVFLQLWDERIQDDPVAVLQTGLMVLLDKPLYLVIAPGQTLPENLRRLARGVLEVDFTTEAGRLRVAQWCKEIAELAT